MGRGVRLWLIAVSICFFVRAGGAQEVLLDDEAEGVATAARLNLPVKTLGGKQFWGDELVLRDWRIQRNVVTGHFRLLDERDVRRAWGSREACVAKFEEIKVERRLEPHRGKVVVLLHGLGRSRQFMHHFAAKLHDDGGYEIVNVSYPSSRGDLASHAQQLSRVIEHLPEATEINFVAHSLGNLVVRHYLHDAAAAAKAAGRPLDARIKRFVMVGPPNHGAAMARLFDDVPLYDVVLRGVGKDLAEFAALHEKLGAPSCEFAILAGGKGDDDGYSPLIAGDDDLLVRVEETKLTGARDFRLLPVYHAKLGRDEQAIALALKFLQEGCFTTETEREAIGEERDATDD